MPAPLKFLDDSALFTPSELAEFLSVSITTLERLRCQGEGPSFTKIGRRRVAYRWPAVRQWLEARERSSTACAVKRQGSEMGRGGNAATSRF
jgi:predicted DNA-binding transcriptional regulator AlpA